jgi:GNAT superfamily N-acetyltransferase
MPFAMLHRNDVSPALIPLAGFEVHQVWDAEFMARLQGRAVEEMSARFDAGHRAYVAWRNEEPAAWGWVATTSARIGELDASFTIAARERYLWNFVTLPAHRGLGIYPRLLQAIVTAESRDAERFWIAYAPENHASGGGIAKAGFTRLAEMSFDSAGQPALHALVPGGGVVSSRVLGLRVSEEPLAPCWRCVRAGRSGMTCAPGECKCDYQQPKSGCVA